jgi:hypothetical protein
MTNSQITEIAQYLKSEARRELGSSYGVPSQPGPNTARIAMKLVGFEQTVSGAAIVSRIVPIGAVANAVQGATGRRDFPLSGPTLSLPRMMTAFRSKGPTIWT